MRGGMGDVVRRTASGHSSRTQCLRAQQQIKCLQAQRSRSAVVSFHLIRCRTFHLTPVGLRGR